MVVKRPQISKIAVWTRMANEGNCRGHGQNGGSLCDVRSRLSSFCGPDLDFCARLGTRTQSFQGEAVLSV